MNEFHSFQKQKTFFFLDDPVQTENFHPELGHRQTDIHHRAASDQSVIQTQSPSTVSGKKINL